MSNSLNPNVLTHPLPTGRQASPYGCHPSLPEERGRG